MYKKFCVKPCIHVLTFNNLLKDKINQLSRSESHMIHFYSSLLISPKINSILTHIHNDNTMATHAAFSIPVIFLHSSSSSHHMLYTPVLLLYTAKKSIYFKAQKIQPHQEREREKKGHS